MDSQQKALATPSSRPPQSGGAAKALFPIDNDTHVLDRLNAIYKYRSLAITVFSLVMLAATPGGDAYTFGELRQMFENAGFSQNEIIPLQPMPQHLIISSR